MVRARKLSGISVCLYVCFFFVCGLFLQLLNYQTPTCFITSESAEDLECDLPTPQLSLVCSTFQTFSTTGLLIGTCMNESGLVVRRLRIHSQSAPLVPPAGKRAVAFHSFNLFTSLIIPVFSLSADTV